MNFLARLKAKLGQWFKNGDDISYIKLIVTITVIGIFVYAVFAFWPTFFKNAANDKEKDSSEYVEIIVGILCYLIPSIILEIKNKQNLSSKIGIVAVIATLSIIITELIIVNFSFDELGGFDSLFGYIIILPAGAVGVVLLIHLIGKAIRNVKNNNHT